MLKLWVTPAVPGVIPDFQAIVDLRTRRLFKDEAHVDTNNCEHGKKTA